MARPKNSILMLSVARMAAVGCQFAALPVLARLLSPVEFGLVAIAMAVVGLTNALSDAGLGKSLLRLTLTNLRLQVGLLDLGNDLAPADHVADVGVQPLHLAAHSRADANLCAHLRFDRTGGQHGGR